MTHLELPRGFESITHLGEPENTYGRGTLARTVGVVSSGVCLFGSIGVGYFGLVVYPQRFPDMVETHGWLFIAIAVVMLIGALLWVWRVVARWNDAAVVYDEGFAYLKGKGLQVRKWSDVAWLSMYVARLLVYGFIPVGTTRRYTIADHKANQIALDTTLFRVEHLFDDIRKATFPHRMARARRVFEAGQVLRFGPIGVSRDGGVWGDNRRYAWHDIAGVLVNTGTVIVSPKEKGPFAALFFQVANVPNVDVFLAIADEVLADEHPQTT